MSWAERMKASGDAMMDGTQKVDPLIESFTWCGVRCQLLKGNYGANGYVILPFRAAWRVRDLGAAAMPFEVHGGITYRDHHGRCIGFSTSHPGDVWPRGEAMAYSMDRMLATMMADVVERHPPPDIIRVDWTLDKVRVETRHLAEQVAALNYVLPLRPAGRAMRRRLRSALKGSDG